MISREELELIEHCLRTEGKVCAIKELRELTGWGLKHAKGEIECYQKWKEWSVEVKYLIKASPVELTTSKKLPKELSIELIREVLCQTSSNCEGSSLEWSCSGVNCEDCALSVREEYQVTDKDFLINVINLLEE